MKMTDQRLKLLSKLSAVLFIALALKYHYSTASVNELRWILAPTGTLVELITGIRFAFEPHAGYMSADNRFLIAASCAGLNFLIVAFLLMTIGPLWRERSLAWSSIPVALVAAFLATLAANTTRILIAILLQRADIGGDSLHRVEGILVYFGFLVFLFFLTEHRGLWHRRSGLLCLLAVYYSVTLGIPILRGAFLEQLFWNHAIVVLLVPAIIVLIVSMGLRRVEQLGD
jgi:exosortase K